MGQICDSCQERFNDEGDNYRHQSLTENYRFGLSANLMMNDVNQQLKQLENFIYPSNQFPEQLRVKYIIQLLQLREKVIERMKSHIDKYNGSCYLREKLIEYVFDNKQAYRKKSNMSDQSEYSEVSNNPQEGDVLNTSCEEGKLYNNQMQKIVKYLQILQYNDNSGSLNSQENQSFEKQLDNVVKCIFIVKF